LFGNVESERSWMSRRAPLCFPICVFFALLISACNLNNTDVIQETIQSTGGATSTGLPTRTPNTTSNAPTTLPLTNLAPTSVIRPTSIVSVPVTAVLPPTANIPAQPVSIVILSPVPGNIVAGNVQVLGSATHPQFLQYQVEFGPDPNPSQLWYPATNAVQQPVLNGLLGVWNTNATQDGLYQLRLRVYLRDGTTLSTVVNNVRVQNRQPTPIPSATQNVPRPIAAFTQDVASGQVPLTVRFTNQSNGTISSMTWNFGDGQSSTETNPVHTFNSPGLYNVTLTVNGPGGSSNVSRQINVQSQTAPVAAFTQDRTSGNAPLTIRFTNQSTGNITSLLWNFSDGTTSNQQNPEHVFNVAGTYNVFLTATGPGGTSSTTRQIVVNAVASATFTPTATATTQPQATFTPTPTSTEVPPTATFTLTTEPPTATFTASPTTLAAPIAQFSADPTTGNADLIVTFTDQSQGLIDSYTWDFNGDGTVDSTTPGNQTFTYDTPGSYTARLTVSNSGGSSAPFEVLITVDAPLSVPSVIDSIEVQPDLSSSAGALTTTFTTGEAMGRQPTIFSIAGDEFLSSPGVLDPFASPGGYNLGSNTDLQGIVNFYGANAPATFARTSAAANTGWTAAALLDPANVDPSCGTESALTCELSTNQPSIMLISVGYHDALNGTPSDAFRSSLEQIVQITTTSGTIPVLLTVPNSPQLDQAQVNAINDAILSVGTQYGVPVLNTGRALNESPNGFSASPSGGGDLSAADQYGINAINLNILRVLDSLLDTVAPGTVQ
jgi:PKD repeat protein